MVKRALPNGQNFLFKTQNTIISAASIMALAYGVTALLGLIRTRLLAAYFGDAPELAVFYTADKIPTLIYSLLVVGTLSSVFIPVFTGLLKKSASLAWETATSAINLSLVSFLILGSVAFVLSPAIIRAISLGNFTPEQILLGANVMRIMVFAQFILIISSFVTAILQSFKYFLIPALAPVLYNLGMILGITLLAPSLGIYGPAMGVLAGASLHFLIQLPILLKRTDFRFSPRINLSTEGLREMFLLLPPRVLGSGMVQVSSIVSTSLAILVSTSSVIYLRFADQLQSFPVNFFGASIALASLPSLCYETLDENKTKFKKTFLNSFFQIMFLAVPSGVILLVLRVPVVRLVYGAANYPWGATLETALTLGCFSLSIFAQSAVYLLTRAFYAFKDTRTPLKISIFTIVLNMLLSFVFVRLLGLGVWSIAMASSITSYFDFVILLWYLAGKVGGFTREEIAAPFFKISVSAILMGFSLYVPMKLLDIKVLDTTRTVNLLILTGVVLLAGVVSYLGFTYLLRVKEVEMMYKLLRKLNLAKSELPQESVVDKEAL